MTVTISDGAGIGNGSLAGGTGTITLYPSRRLADANRVVEQSPWVLPVTAGMFADVQMIATDDSSFDSFVDPWCWIVTERLDGHTKTFGLLVSSALATQNYSSLTRVDPRPFITMGFSGAGNGAKLVELIVGNGPPLSDPPIGVLYLDLLTGDVWESY